MLVRHNILFSDIAPQDKCHFEIFLFKLKPANFAVFYIKAISNNIDNHNEGLNSGQGWGRLQLVITLAVMITCHFYLSITIMITIIHHCDYR